MTSTDAQIFSTGHRPFTGQRKGPASAMLAVFRTTVRRSLGIRRSARFKIVPVMILAISYIPAIVLAAVNILLPESSTDTTTAAPGEPDLSTIPGYLSLISITLLLFAAFIGPDVLSGDRRTGMLSIYLTSSLTKGSYLLAKTAAVSAILLVAILGPTSLLFVAGILDGGLDPGVVVDLTRLVASGLVVSLVFTAVTMAASASTDQGGVATAITLTVLLGGAGLSAAAAEAENAPAWLRLVDVMNLPVEMSARLYGEPGTPEWAALSTASVLLAIAGISVVAASWIWYRYRLVQVTR